LAQGKPTADGTLADWTGDYTDIDAVGINDNTLINAFTNGDTSTFDKTALPAAFNSGYSVVGVMLSARSQVVDPAADIVAASYVDGNPYTGASFGATISRGPSQVLLAENPDTTA